MYASPQSLDSPKATRLQTLAGGSLLFEDAVLPAAARAGIDLAKWVPPPHPGLLLSRSLENPRARQLDRKFSQWSLNGRSLGSLASIAAIVVAEHFDLVESLEGLEWSPIGHHIYTALKKRYAVLSPRMIALLSMAFPDHFGRDNAVLASLPSTPSHPRALLETLAYACGSTLTVLNLSRTQLGDSDLPYLHNLPKLRVLDLSFTLLTDVGLVAFVRPIDFASSSLSEPGAIWARSNQEVASDWLVLGRRCCCSIQSLSLKGLGTVSDRGIGAIARKLRHLSVLDVGQTLVSTNGLEALGRTHGWMRISALQLTTILEDHTGNAPSEAMLDTPTGTGRLRALLRMSPFAGLTPNQGEQSQSDLLETLRQVHAHDPPTFPRSLRRRVPESSLAELRSSIYLFRDPDSSATKRTSSGGESWGDEPRSGAKAVGSKRSIGLSVHSSRKKPSLGPKLWESLDDHLL